MSTSNKYADISKGPQFQGGLPSARRYGRIAHSTRGATSFEASSSVVVSSLTEAEVNSETPTRAEQAAAIVPRVQAAEGLTDEEKAFIVELLGAVTDEDDDSGAVSKVGTAK